jgi:ATP-dependent Clp protease ATP-binding subunit ClpA
VNSEPSLNLVNVWPTLLAAAEEARRTAHPHIGSEHLALLALGGPDGIEAMAAEGGLDASVIRAALEACCEAEPVTREAAITPRTARILAYAAQLALVARAPEIRPIDLIMVLLNDPLAIAWRGLLNAGISPDILASGVNRRLGFDTEAPRRSDA